MSTEDQETIDGIEQSFTAALQAVRNAPESQAGWDHVAELAETLGRQEIVADTYLEVLSSKPSASICEQLFDAAIGYHDEWFGDDPAAMNRVLSKVLEVDPKALWAFDRLTVVLSAAQQWDELLSAHDRMLESEKDPDQLKTLLSEAANVAKDFAADPERAADYMLRHLEMDPSNKSLATSAQRLLEKGKSWNKLVGLWREQTKQVTPKKARALRVQIAECYLDNLDESEHALNELGSLLDEKPGDLEVCQVMERVLSHESSNDDIRLAALGRLTSNYDAAKQKEAAVTAIEKVIGVISDEKKPPLYREVGLRYATLGKDVEAARHYSLLLVAKPTDVDARKQLRHLAGRSNQHDVHAKTLVDACDVCEESTLKVALMIEAAHLYWDNLSDTETAIELFTRVLAVEDVDQTTALSAAHSLNELHNTEDRQESRLEVLEQLANLERSAEVRKAVIGEAAQLAASLGNNDKALEFWQMRLESDKADIEAMSALIGLLEKKEDWDNLITALERRADADVLPAQRRIDMVRIASIQKDHQGNTEAAIDTWLGILEEFGSEADVLSHLDNLMESIERWSDLATVLENSVGQGHIVTASWLSRLGDIYSLKLEDTARAADFYIGALNINPGSEESRKGLLVLCDVPQTAKKATESLAKAYLHTDDSELLIDLLELRLGAIDDTWAKVRILEETSQLQELRQKDHEAALTSLARAFKLAPENMQLERDIQRLADETGLWPIAVQAFLNGATGSQPEKNSSLRLNAAAILEGKLNDVSGASTVVRTVLENNPTHLEALNILAGLERKINETSLVDTLCLIDALEKNDLDPLREACERLVETKDNLEECRQLFVKLYHKAAGIWEQGIAVEGAQQPKLCTAWAIENCERLDKQDSRSDRSVQLLLEGARLPFDPGTSRNMKLRAASILADNGDHASAIDVYFSVLTETPQDTNIIRNLAVLLKLENRTLELLSVLRKELALTTDADKCLELRLEIEMILRGIEGSNERFQTIAANLEQEPGHGPSITALNTLLGEQVSYADAIELMTDQAEKLVTNGNSQGAARLFTMVANLKDKYFADSIGASEAYARVVKLDCTVDALDALARLATQRGAHQETTTWLSQRLDSTEDPANRIQVMLKLAKAQLQAGQRPQATATLEAAFEEAPQNAEVRRLLAMQYRTLEQWESLTNVLSVAAENSENKTTIMTHVQEVRQICQNQLGKLDLAVPILERATKIDPEDRDLRIALAQGLRSIGRLDEAKTLADGVIEEFGRRRSVDRAAAHLILARIADDRDEQDDALSELETASTMDSQNIEIWQQLALLARKFGELDKAERAYRTLLIIIRRSASKKIEKQMISQSEVFIELARISRERDQAEQSDELYESAFEVLTMDEREVKSFTDKLVEWERPDLVERVIEVRLAQTNKPRKRGNILTEYADMLDSRLNLPDDAFDTRMKALDNDPGQPTIHDVLYAKAIESDRLETYLDKLQSLLANARRGKDVQIRCELLLRLCTVMERNKKDFEAAKELYLEAEAIGVREVDVWKAGIRVATALDDTEEQTRLLTSLSSLGEDQESETRADVYYRLAEIQLASEDTLGEGIQSMEKAIEESPRFTRPGRILGRACVAHPADENLLLMYERIARQSGSPQMLLEALELLIIAEQATIDQAHEGALLALELEANDRAEDLMTRAIELSSDLIDGTAHVPWALMGLARLRKDAGDLAGAVKWISEAVDVADSSEVFALARELTALLVEPSGDLTLATRLYERLFERDPSVREVWEPLAELYARLGNNDRLERLLEEVQGYINDPDEQRALRFKQAQLSLAIPGREPEAIELLKNILIEDPTNQSAMNILLEYLKESGNVDELHDLLLHQFENAISQNDGTRIRESALGLGEFLKQNKPDEAAAVYRTALEKAPNEYELVKNLLASIGKDADQGERASLLKKMIEFEPNDRVPSITLEAAAIFDMLENADEALAVLKLGFQREPANSAVRELLIATYKERGDEAGIAEMLVQAAGSQQDSSMRLSMLKEASDIYRNSLSDPETAVLLLRQIVEIAPESTEHVLDLARALTAADNFKGAMHELSEFLSKNEQSESKIDILKARAEVASGIGDFEQALADLESAFAIDPSSSTEALENTLHKQRATVASSGDTSVERVSVLRLAELMILRDSDDEARLMLETWLKNVPQDIEVKKRLLDLHKKAERWVDVAGICAALVEVEEGEVQAEAAIQLAQACRNAETPELARKGLEFALEHQPENSEVREALHSIYELVGAHKELGEILLKDAQDIEDTDEKAATLTRAGVLFLSVDDTTTAKSVLAQSLELKPDDTPTILALVDVHLACEEADIASELIQKGIDACKGKRDPNLAIMHQRMARLAKLRGDFEGEIKWLKQAALGDRNNGQISMELVERAEELEDWETAIWAIRIIARMKENSPLTKAEIALRQAKISLVQGDKRKAALFARQAKKEDPDSEETKQLLDELGLK